MQLCKKTFANTALKAVSNTLTVPRDVKQCSDSSIICIFNNIYIRGGVWGEAGERCGGMQKAKISKSNKGYSLNTKRGLNTLKFSDIPAFFVNYKHLQTLVPYKIVSTLAFKNRRLP